MKGTQEGKEGGTEEDGKVQMSRAARGGAGTLLKRQRVPLVCLPHALAAGVAEGSQSLTSYLTDRPLRPTYKSKEVVSWDHSYRAKGTLGPFSGKTLAM